MLHELRRRENQTIRFSVLINPLTEIMYSRRAIFSRRERENCDTSGGIYKQVDALSAESIDLSVICKRDKARSKKGLA